MGASSHYLCCLDPGNMHVSRLSGGVGPPHALMHVFAPAVRSIDGKPTMSMASPSLGLLFPSWPFAQCFLAALEHGPSLFMPQGRAEGQQSRGIAVSVLARPWGGACGVGKLAQMHAKASIKLLFSSLLVGWAVNI